MTTIKRIADLSSYTGVLPYASELFGVYQPLLGWASKRQKKRFDAGFQADKSAILKNLQNQFSGAVSFERHENTVAGGLEHTLKINIKAGKVKNGALRSGGSVLLEAISFELPEYESYDMSIWSTVLTLGKINRILKDTVSPSYLKAFIDRPKPIHDRPENFEGLALSALKSRLDYESSLAGALLYLVKNENHNELENIFYSSKDNTQQAIALVKAIDAEDSSDAFLSIDTLDPTDQEQLKGVSLSPISVVHLFRQYFFELDTFLGTPESHVWLSPGSSVEIIEEQTRKSIVENTFESTLDIFSKTETETRTQDEISDSVKEENAKDLNLAGSVTAEYTKIQATASFDYNSSQNKSREKTHEKMREQTSKISSEIRKNFKTSFRTVTEFTEFSHSKHILANTSEKLINYELRRKMRQVGVQVQDVGTYLCWQTFVDDPGKELGLSKLVHLAESPELGGLPHPEEIPRHQTFAENRSVSIPFVPNNPEGADKDEVYKNGVEIDGNNEGRFGSGDLEKIIHIHDVKFISPRENHKLESVEFIPTGSLSVSMVENSFFASDDGQAGFKLRLDVVNFEGANSIQINMNLFWVPTSVANTEIDAKNKKNTENFKAAERQAYESAYLETFKERVDAVSNITTRNRDELREEERIVIYRQLIQGLLQNNISQPDDRTRHVVSELINSIFDVDKMLYFVAPEWWRPKIHRSTQQLVETDVTKSPKPKQSSLFGLTAPERLVATAENSIPRNTTTPDTASKLLATNIAGWGGVGEAGRDNYYITEDSTPAKFGSSLGWLLQLDGDNRRNAFLNAPWVKAVIPIRPGKEKAALNWLRAVEGDEGFFKTDGTKVKYQTDNPKEVDINNQPYDGQDMEVVLEDLAERIKRKHQEGLRPEDYNNGSNVFDPALVDEENAVTATPIDRVYEHGFYPLEDSFRSNTDGNYEIFDQWIEILPTDQTVPVEVEYDPKTGRQV